MKANDGTQHKMTAVSYRHKLFHKHKSVKAASTNSPVYVLQSQQIIDCDVIKDQYYWGLATTVI